MSATNKAKRHAARELEFRAPRKLDEVRIVRLPEILKISGLSKPTIWRLQRHGEFPGCVRIGRRAIGWFESDIADWLASRVKVNAAQQSA